MTVLTMHAYDEGERRVTPAYSVCVTRGRAFVRAIRQNWEPAAERLQNVLNAGRLAQGRTAQGVAQDEPH